MREKTAFLSKGIIGVAMLLAMAGEIFARSQYVKIVLSSDKYDDVDHLGNPTRLIHSAYVVDPRAGQAFARDIYEVTPLLLVDMTDPPRRFSGGADYPRKLMAKRGRPFYVVEEIFPPSKPSSQASESQRAWVLVIRTEAGWIYKASEDSR